MNIAELAEAERRHEEQMITVHNIGKLEKTEMEERSSKQLDRAKTEIVEARSQADAEANKNRTLMQRMSKLEELQTEAERLLIGRPLHNEMAARIQELSEELERKRTEIEVVQAKGEKDAEEAEYLWQDNLHYVVTAESLTELFERYSEVFAELRTDDENWKEPPARAEARNLKTRLFTAEKCWMNKGRMSETIPNARRGAWQQRQTVIPHRRRLGSQSKARSEESNKRNDRG